MTIRARTAARRALTGCILGGLTLPATHAWADGGSRKGAHVTKAQCLAANAEAQELRIAHKLSESRDRLLRCSDPACPSIVRDDCTHRLDELEAAQPTIIFDTKDGSGHDLTAVSVTVDGKRLSDRLDGSPLPLDPGDHAFTFTTADQPPVTLTFVLKEGEKGRRERIVIGPVPPPAPLAPVEPAAPALPPPTTPSGAPPLRTAGFVVGGVGVAGLAVGAIFTALAVSNNSSSNANGHCDASGCDSTGVSLRNKALDDATASTVGFIAGGVLAAAGVALVVFAPHPSSTTTGRVELVPVVAMEAVRVGASGGAGVRPPPSEPVGFSLRGSW